MKYKIRVPKLLSFLAYSSFKSEVKGLHEYPEEDRPPLYIHYFFDTMVTIGVLMILLSLAYVFGRWGKWKWIHSRLFRWLIVLSGPLSIVAIEAGWWLAEQGRQPWILYGIMRTDQAATTATGVEWLFIVFAIVYFILGVGSIVVLHRMFKNNPAEKELAVRKGIPILKSIVQRYAPYTYSNT